MKMITKEGLHELAGVHDPFCISIYIPAHASGQEVLKHEDAIVLKNQLKDIKEKLKTKGLEEIQIAELLEPVEKLLTDTEFWRNQSDGAVFFLADKFFRNYSLPSSVKAFNYLSGNFYLLPLLPLFNTEISFYLLLLELEDVKLYKCSKNDFKEIVTEGLVPRAVEEVTGSDYRDKTLQMRKLGKGQGAGIYHGHGEGKDDHKIEVKKYLKEVNKGLMSLVGTDNLPMVVSCVEYMFPIFKDISNYNNLYPEYLPALRREIDIKNLHEKAMELLEKYFNKEMGQKAEQYMQFHGTGRATNNIDDTVAAALSGKIDTLFLDMDTDVYGIYNAAKNKVELADRQKAENVSLFNLAAVKTFFNRGKVYLMKKEKMPDGFSSVNALYRY